MSHMAWCWLRRVELSLSLLEGFRNLRTSSRLVSSTSASLVHSSSGNLFSLKPRQYSLSGYYRLFSHLYSLSGQCSLSELQRKNNYNARHYSKKTRTYSDKKQKDLYAIIGVSPHATQVQIKQAYYRLSMKYHPDRNRGSDDAHQKFTELTEAYSILGQYDLRRKYDKGMLHQYPRQPSHTQPPHHHGTSHSGASTVHGKKSRFDFDEFYRAHYGEALRREQEARRNRAAAKERAKLYSISNSWQQMLIIAVTISVLLVGWYGYQRHYHGNRTTSSHDQG